MLGACIYIQVGDLPVTKTGLREHAFDSPPYEFGRSLGEDLLGSRETLSAGVSGVAGVDPVGHLLAEEAHFLSEKMTMTLSPQST